MTARKSMDEMILRNCALISARDVRVGHRVCFLDSRYDYIVEGVDTCVIGVKHTHSNGEHSSYHPGELLYVQRQPDLGAAQHE